MATPALAMLFQATGQGRSISKSNSYSGSASISIEESVANSATDFAVVVAIDVSAIKAIYINSSKAVTMETNSGSAADESISLLADKPYVWTNDSYFANLLETDITVLYFTNASGSAATVNIEVVLDATP
jgi:hypothetical protein